MTEILIDLAADGIARSKLEIVQDCGHLSTIERPDAVTEALRAWIARLHPLGPIFAIFGASDRDKSLDLKV